MKSAIFSLLLAGASAFAPASTVGSAAMFLMSKELRFCVGSTLHSLVSLARDAANDHLSFLFLLLNSPNDLLRCMRNKCPSLSLSWSDLRSSMDRWRVTWDSTPCVCTFVSAVNR